jgi:RNA polymerase sigma factor (TIGR02999 family)
MGGVTQILTAIESGDPSAAGELLPMVYAELRRLAAQCMATEKPGQTLNPTALVHEAYVRLVDVDRPQRWDGRRHFFAAAAESMRRVLIERARSKQTEKHGGGVRRVDFDHLHIADETRPEELLMLDEALTELEQHDSQIAALVKLRFFAGLSHQESAAALGITRRAADRLWTLARAWLFRRMTQE